MSVLSLGAMTFGAKVTWIDESIETKQDLIKEGLVNYPGISNFAAWQMATAQARAEERGYSRYETTPMNYSPLNRNIEHEIVLVGAKTMEQFEENLGALDVNLSRDQIGKLDKLTRHRVQYPNWMIERQSSGRAFPVSEPAWTGKN